MSNSCIPYPSVWTYKTDLPENFQGIHVITNSGILYARKTDDSISTENYLPLRTDISDSVDVEYKNKCLSANSDSALPYSQLTASNKQHPASFIFNEIWGPNAVLVVTPPVTVANKKDILTAIDFIHRNMSMGSVFLAYTPGQELLYPNKKTTDEILNYYEKVINNNTQSEHRQRKEGTQNA